MSVEHVVYVTKIETKSGMSRNNKPYTVYNVTGTNKAGESIRVGWGFDAPTFQEGEWIKTQVEQEGQYLNYKGAPVEAAAGSAPQASASAPTGSTSTAGQSKDGYWEAKDKYYKEEEVPRITFAAARTAAVTFLGILDNNDALPISGAKGKAGEAKRYAQLHDMLDKLSVQFYHDGETLRLLESVADAGDVDVKARGELPGEIEAPEPEGDTTPAATQDDFDDDIPF